MANPTFLSPIFSTLDKLLFPERCNKAATGSQNGEPGDVTRLPLTRC